MTRKSQALYPDNWKELAANIKAAKGWKCQQCGKVCIKPGQKIPDDWTKSQRRAYLKGRRYRLKRRFYKLHSIDTFLIILPFTGI
jgi:hypothetical protein